MVRVRQLAYGVRDRLLTGPIILIALGVMLALIMPQIDQAVGSDSVPQSLKTTIEGGRAILTALASGLITSATLLLSLVLVAVQLASSQFSPRTLREWTGDTTQQVAIGLVVGTSVYCLLILRETQTNGADRDVPHLSVLLAIVLGIGSLLAVLRAVDALTKRLRVGSVVRKISDRTLALVDGDARSETGPWAEAVEQTMETPRPAESELVTTTEWGWVQQIDEDAILQAIDEGATAELLIDSGSFVLPGAPIVSISPPPSEESVRRVCRSIAIGEERTLQQDLDFGVMQLVDIAIRALSPGVNDPNTACDVIRNLGVIVLRAWEQPDRTMTRSDGVRTLVRQPRDRGQLLEDAFGPIRRYGANDATVVVALLDTLAQVSAECVRRVLPGPLAPIDDAIKAVLDEFDRTDPSPTDRAIVATRVSTQHPRLETAAVG